MAWKDTLQDASFRGVKFDCQRTTDSIEREVARYAYPNVDGEDLEDQGLKTRDVSITAVFFGDDYEAQMKRLLSALSTRGTGELIHPVFGSLPDMMFLGATVSHDAENPDACLVEMRFSASKPSNPFFSEALASQKADATAQLADVAQEAGTNLFGQALDALNTARTGFRRLNALRDVMSGTLGPLRALVVGFRGTALDYLSFPGAFASDLVGLISGIADLRSFDPGIVMSDWTGLSEQMGAIVKLPASSAAGQSIEIPGTPPVVTVPTAPTDPSAPYSPPRAAAVMADPADVQLVTTIVKIVTATVAASVSSDVLANEVDTPTLTPDQIETITNDVRAKVQDAIDEVRRAVPIDQAWLVTEPLKDVALSIQTLAIGVIDTLPPIITRTVSARANLMLLAFRWYGDYRRSAELLRLNPAVRNPNFIERGDVIRGFAR